MSNERRDEMTNDIDIDLASIPHPKDCYPVPNGAVIPKGTPIWRIHSSGLAVWSQNGYANEYLVHEVDVIHLTANPITTHPTPDDSPIIITRTNVADADVGDGLLAVWMPGGKAWCVATEYGCSYWLDSCDITEWSPTIVTKSGHSLWDERDKRDRMDASGGIWEWEHRRSAWVCNIGAAVTFFGSLNTLAEYFGADYLVGFADEQGGEK